jgi:hypothetical protein
LPKHFSNSDVDAWITVFLDTPTFEDDGFIGTISVLIAGKIDLLWTFELLLTLWQDVDF